jgi:hypothetical protein
MPRLCLAFCSVSLIGLIVCFAIFAAPLAAQSRQSKALKQSTSQSVPQSQQKNGKPERAAAPSPLVASASKLAAEPRVRVLGDSLIIFTPARPFVERVETTRRPANALGVIATFAFHNGFGGGLFYQRELSPLMALGVDVFVSGRQSTDELLSADSRFTQYVVPEKVNRLLIAPLMASVQYRFPQWEVIEGVRPFVQAGLGATLIVATPYLRNNVYYEFFSSFEQARLFGRVGGFLGAGATFTASNKTHSQITVRYYVIPFGGDGLESMNSATTGIPPIKDFGGVFVTFQIGLKW